MRGRRSPRFVVDVMLGKLAKWLRILGYDTLYFNKIEDHVLKRIAIQQGRILLTRDRDLIHRGNCQSLLILDDHWPDQLRQLIDQLHVQITADFLSRCCRCNAILNPVDKEEIKDRVPPYVYKTKEKFLLCPGCKRIYWSGTHVEQMRGRIQNISGR